MDEWSESFTPEVLLMFECQSQETVVPYGGASDELLEEDEIEQPEFDYEDEA